VKWLFFLLLGVLLLSGCSSEGYYLLTSTVYNSSIINITNNISYNLTQNITTTYNYSVNESRYVVNFTVDDVGSTITHTLCLANDTCYSTAFTDSSGGIDEEVDPVYSAWDKDFLDLINTPENLSQFFNDINSTITLVCNKDFNYTGVITANNNTLTASLALKANITDLAIKANLTQTNANDTLITGRQTADNTTIYANITSLWARHIADNTTIYANITALWARHIADNTTIYANITSMWARQSADNGTCTAGLALKVNLTDYNTALALKSNLTQTNANDTLLSGWIVLNNNSLTAALTAGLALKANITDLVLKQNQTVELESFWLNDSFHTMQKTAATATTRVTYISSSYMHFYPFRTEYGYYIDQLNFMVTIANTTWCMMGVYNDTGRLYPDRLLVNTSLLNCEATGQKQQNFTPLYLKSNSVYWIAFGCNTSNTSTLRGHNVYALEDFFGTTSTDTNSYIYGRYASVPINYTQYMPLTFPVTSSTTQAAPPFVKWRVRTGI